MYTKRDKQIRSIHSKTHILTVLLSPGPTQHLPFSLLLPNPSDAPESTREMDASTPTMLETGVLDVDGRVERARRPNGNAWKCFTVWRWPGEDGVPEDGVDLEDGGGRGGRENQGTLFYLRGCYYHDR
jgi:hypothetical protein